MSALQNNKINTLARILKTKNIVEFKHKRHFIYIQQQSDAEYKGDIHYSKMEYKKDTALNAGICITLVPKIAIEYFIKLSDGLIERGL